MQENTQNAISFVYPLVNSHLAGSFGFNTNLLDNNLINLAVVVGILVYFGKGVLSTLLNNRKEVILNTIRDAEERYQEAIEKLNQARIRLQQAKTKADEIRVNGLFQIEKEKLELIKAAEEDSKRLEESRNATIRFEEQRVIEQVRQQVSRLALERSFQTLNNLLKSSEDVHGRLIKDYINMFEKLETPVL